MAEIKKLTKKKYPVKLPHYDVSIDILKSSNGRDWSHDYYNIDDIHANGFTGAGVKVAVIDTGIDLTHSCFKKANEEGRIKTFDSRPRKNDPTDGNGHGCITPNSLVMTTLCGMNTIEEFYNRVSGIELLGIIDENNKSISKELIDNIYTTSWNGSFFIEDRITHVHKLKYDGDLIVLNTNEGILELTPWHPVYIVTSTRGKEKTVIKKRADNVIIGDKILCSNNHDLNQFNYRYIDDQKLDEDFAYLSGLILSDGHITKRKDSIIFTNKDLNLISTFSNLCKKILKKEAKINFKNDFYEAVIYSKNLCNKLIDLGIPSGNKSLIVDVPELITKSPLSVIESFYGGVIDGDGNINNGRVRIISGSKKFCENTVKLMKILGYNSSYNINSTKGFKNNDISITYSIRMPNINYRLCGYKKNIERKSSYDRSTRSIVSISRKKYFGNLYDFTIEKNHNYISNNGYVVSNTWVASRYIGTNSIIGFSPDIELYVYKALEDDGTGDVEVIIKAAKHAIDSGCHIISTSVGWPDNYPRFQSIVDYAESKNVLWISASGNDYSKDDIDYPAVLRYIISCGSINKKGKRSNFSDFGKELDLYSSGEDVIGAYTKNRNAVMDGTSMATPSLGALFSLVYFYIIEQHGSINRETIKKLATCL